MKFITNKLTYTLAALFAVLVFIISSMWGGGAAVVHAATSTTTAFEKSEVMDDLKTATINGKPFDTANYPYDSTGIIKHPEIMTVVEYCYSIRPAQRENYGVYIYFYNPQALNISTASMANKIMLGVKYGTDKDGNITVDDYEKFALQFCSKSTGDYHDLFYKFKVIDHKSAVDGKTIEQRVNSNARRYDISEIELITVGDKNATAYGVGGTYTFTGYAKGYGADQNAESTLACEWKTLETVRLKTTSTFYRTGEYKRNVQHDLTSVYFSVPNDLFEKYGNLQKIKADWYEYETTPIAITSNNEVYENLAPWIGKSIGKVNNDMPLSIYTGFQELSNAAGHFYSYDWVYNAYGGNSATGGIAPANEYCERLNWLFSTNGSNISEYVLSSSRLQEYIETYDKSNDSGYLTVPSENINADLFEKVLSSERAAVDYLDGDIHHKQVNFDAGDMFNMLNYDESNSGCQKFFERLFGLAPSSADESYKGISPIRIVKDEDIVQPDIAKKLLIDGRDEPLKKFKDFYNTSVADNDGDGKPDNKVVLFRFAVTDFERLPVICYNNKQGKNYDKQYGASTFIAQESVFYDFDIIDLTFSKEGKLTVIPVVHSPIDIFNDITLPKVETPDWWKWVKFALGLIVAILIIVLLYPIISPILGFIVKGLLWLITAPFKAIAKLFKHKKE